MKSIGLYSTPRKSLTKFSRIRPGTPPDSPLAIDASAVPADGDEPTPPAAIWQIDTGVVLVPDLSRRWENPIEGMSLGYIATNNRGKQTHAADFVLEQPTPIGGGREVLHFSAPFSLPATSRLFALPRPG